ncbi:excisionase [Bacillus sp. VT 712]|uniref:helix-turn-helix domain-containing protein n=1 Tax=Bacillaceae TaxID=186817 RepID=UPI0004730843|nr:MULTISPECIES: helix-turn-helix domain-containing protein [Bacillaceae]KZB90104.1 excisionase [Bacillus sp. VT 712]USY55871.1 helix-turn-helix domain-containing protein [Bacillus sp. 1780r2a1]WEZ08123.1 helix-turn-helix domain-containing protein [Priestia flexa]
MHKTIEDYPFILTAVHIAEILTISKPTAYELMEQTSFPLIRIGRNKRVRKDEFFNWLKQQQQVSGL